MPSSSANPQFSTSRIPANPPHPVHPAINPQPNMPFTLLPNSDGLTYSIRFFNSGTDQQVRVFLMAFATDPNNPTWSDASLSLPPNFQPPYINTLSFYKASLNGATNLWIGCWWDDGSYSNAAAYFAAHPSDPNHHTVPVTTG